MFIYTIQHAVKCVLQPTEKIESNRKIVRMGLSEQNREKILKYFFKKTTQHILDISVLLYSVLEFSLLFFYFSPILFLFISFLYPVLSFILFSPAFYSIIFSSHPSVHPSLFIRFSVVLKSIPVEHWNTTQNTLGFYIQHFISQWYKLHSAHWNLQRIELLHKYSSTVLHSSSFWQILYICSFLQKNKTLSWN